MKNIIVSLIILVTLIANSCSEKKVDKENGKEESILKTSEIPPQDTLQSNFQIAQQSLSEALMNFGECVKTENLDGCIQKLISQPKNAYEYFSVGEVLFSIDESRSSEMHEKAYLLDSVQPKFLIKQAMHLQRKGNFLEAKRLYLKYQESDPNDGRVNVWLSECYLNLGEYEQSFKTWLKTGHRNNAKQIDLSIYLLNTKKFPLKERNVLRERVLKGNEYAAYRLIYLDMNWPTSWNNTRQQVHFAREDLELIRLKMGDGSEVVNLIKTYIEIKLDDLANNKPHIEELLGENQLLINEGKIPIDGKIAGDLLRIAMRHGLLQKEIFFVKRGDELLKLANKHDNVEFVNMYAFLEYETKGDISKETDLLGWNKFKDERFAISYIIGLAEKNTFNGKELKKALKDFPNCSKLLWVKTNCAKIENREVLPHLVALMKQEFKDLASNPERISAPLDTYFYLLKDLTIQ